LIEDIWDSIAKSNAQLPTPERQIKELESRYESLKKGELELHDWDAVHETLRKKYQ
jgi:putative addiction module component (TIGR02574 family)